VADVAGQQIFIAAGLGDCEAVHDGWLLQPVNAFSSLAFAVAGVVIMVWAGRATGHERSLRLIFGVFMIATGVGSFLFHGFDHAVAQFLHDITFLSVVWLLAVINVTEVRGWDRRAGWLVVLAGIVGFSITLVFAPTITNVLTVLVTLALIASDIELERRDGIRRRWWILSLVAMALAVGLFVLGRTGGPLCDPGSPFQGHALWHILSAVAIGLYFVATSRGRMRRKEHS